MQYVYRRDDQIARLPVAPYVFRDTTNQIVTYPERKKFKPELCGSSSGYQQHRRFKQDICDDCRAAFNIYQQGYRAGVRIGRNSEC